MSICIQCHKHLSYLDKSKTYHQTKMCSKCEYRIYKEHLKEIHEGKLPVSRADIYLASDEICHLNVSAVYTKNLAKLVKSISGKLIATNQKLYFIAASNSYAVTWSSVLTVSAGVSTVHLVLSGQGTRAYRVEDGIYVGAVLSTLTSIAKRQMVNVQPSRQIPQNVKSQVWQRDQGRCCQCGAKENLEFDHVIPFSKGGANTVNNIQILCRSCNQKKGPHI